MSQVRFVRLLKVGVAAAILVLALTAGAAFAQPPDMPPLPGEVIIADVQTPRGLSVDANGNLILAVVGNGGDTVLEVPSIEDPSVMNPVNVGLSGAVWSIDAEGKATPIVQALPSYALPSETVGLYRAIPHGDSLWLVYTTTAGGHFWGDSVVELDMATLMAKTVINLAGYELANNPDGNEIDSNVSDIAWTADGTLLIADAGANTLYSWTADGGLSVVATWPENSVPTSVEVAANGDVYVGFLGAGLAPGAGKVERWSNGELAETFSGLNAVTDILLDGDTLYAVELVVFGEQGPGPGRVVMLSADGATVVADGIPTPFGIAKGADGALYVSFGTLAFAPGQTGGVLRLAM